MMAPGPNPLPEFDAPPLNELAIGLQFEELPGYSLVRAGEVYALFEADFPLVQEVGPLQSTFETFGSPKPVAPMTFQMIDRPDHPRFWFLSVEGNELVQFQRDKFHHNWRQVDGRSPAEYPRFDYVFAKFAKEAEALRSYARDRYPVSDLKVNQVEITYFNRIYADDPKRLPTASEYFQFLHLTDEAESFDGTLRQVIREDGGRPLGRLYSEVRSGADARGVPLIALNLTFRGPPAAPDVPGALETVRRGHEIVVRSFAHITTKSAHERWRRKA